VRALFSFVSLPATRSPNPTVSFELMGRVETLLVTQAVLRLPESDLTTAFRRFAGQRPQPSVWIGSRYALHAFDVTATLLSTVSARPTISTLAVAGSPRRSASPAVNPDSRSTAHVEYRSEAPHNQAIVQL
jgi:hypothetical protein